MIPGFQNNIPLKDYTTIGLGGNANYFINCKTVYEIKSVLRFSKESNLKLIVISGGSNIVFPDEGFDGVVMKIDSKGIEFSEDGNFMYAKVSAGENWDEFVSLCIEKSLTGVECMSGIPGSVGATPVQNVGAYGQEVKETIVKVVAIDKETHKTISFDNKDCNFSYRESRFKSEDKDRYIITEVIFKLRKSVEPVIRYDELKKYIDSNFELSGKVDLKEKLKIIRKSVLELRKNKSMVIDANDPNTKSCGSFFKNPVLNEKEFDVFKLNIGKTSEKIPFYKSGNDYKISAAWLVENAGFKKGYIYKGVGISKNHTLALININGTAKDLIHLSHEIEKKVFEKSGIRLINEPVIV